MTGRRRRSERVVGSGRAARGSESLVLAIALPGAVAAVGTALLGRVIPDTFWTRGAFDDQALWGVLLLGLFGPVVVGMIAGALSMPGARRLGLAAGIGGVCAGVVAIDATEAGVSPSMLVVAALVPCVLLAIGYGIGAGLADLPRRSR